MEDTVEKYPVSFSIDYSESSDRLTVFFRLIMIIPIFIILGMLLGGGDNDPDTAERLYYAGTGGLIVIPTILMILFRQKYPKWWYNWNLELTKFSLRVLAYLLLLTDTYPSTDEDQGVHLEIPYPDVKKDLNRWLPLVKWLLAIPHLVVLVILWIAVIVNAIITWFIILFTGNRPKGLFDFVVDVMRWTLRVGAYSTLLTTDQYPPFSLEE